MNERMDECKNKRTNEHTLSESGQADSESGKLHALHNLQNF